MLSLLNSLAQGLIKLTHNLAAILLAIAVTLVSYQVFTRFILGDPAAWSEILARGLIIWSVFLVSAAAFWYGAMISIDLFLDRLPPRLRIYGQRLVCTAVLTLLAILVWQGYLITLRVSGQQIAMLEIPMSWFYAAIPTGCAVAIVAVVARQLCAEYQHHHGQHRTSPIRTDVGETL
ncbi:MULTISPECIES: TRAP transporter small permease [Halomonadaceae]|uniref:TRAP transporter small permease protein n=2 Tax=Halomonadaceae TaxID=28256 RepID=A0A246S3L6_9GAMM|nr:MULTISPECIES: TRAP transporter small permease [Halomonas]TDW00007.1 TRAP-type C4-dicarboxylate transport system permease small subunit [Halomonas alkaliantarctica]MBS3668630.1 TRAP transporter small permease [Halomonas boliviensis]MDN3559691.1 TRAP transporter small permease [Halomonas neptunia]OWV31001.1 C4-dicarboxylate transporter [Halomonas campaniensis]WQH11532.1 TRAP transporter small permease [Halomonas neptunia]